MYLKIGKTNKSKRKLLNKINIYLKVFKKATKRDKYKVIVISILIRAYYFKAIRYQLTKQFNYNY